MNIQGPAHIHGLHGVKGPHSNQRTGGTKPSQGTSEPAAELDISPAGEAAAQAAESGIRADLVARVKSEIAAGTYETPEKLDAALDSFLDQIG